MGEAIKFRPRPTPTFNMKLTALLSRRTFSALLFASLATLAGAAEPDWLTFEPKAGPGQGKHIVFLAGDEEYRSEE